MTRLDQIRQRIANRERLTSWEASFLLSRGDMYEELNNKRDPLTLTALILGTVCGIAIGTWFNGGPRPIEGRVVRVYATGILIETGRDMRQWLPWRHVDMSLFNPPEWDAQIETDRRVWK